MAFTKVTLTGVIDTIKAAFTKVNDLIDDLLSTGNGLGASQVGIEDTAGNMDAANVEDALAEIYTDIGSARSFGDTLDEDPDTTTGLTWGYKAGKVRSDKNLSTIASGTVGLTNNTTNYIETTETGVVSKNITGYSQGSIPVRKVVTSGGVQTSSTDDRSFMVAFGFRVLTVVIDDGSNANTIAVTTTSQFNGTAISQEDNLEKLGNTTSFSLDNNGNILTIKNSALGTTSARGLMSAMRRNQSGTNLSVSASYSGTGLRLIFFDDSLGTLTDLTTLVDTGSIEVAISYIDSF